MKRRPSSWLVVLVLLGVTLSTSCSSAIVHIPTAAQRYDHNRTRKVRVSMPPERAFERRLNDGDYAPLPHREFPQPEFVPAQSSADGTPDSHLMVVFTGIPLPLSDTPVARDRGDRADLIDYLAAGPLAQVGVDPGDVTGNVAESTALYAVILDLLADRSRLTQKRHVLLQWAKAQGLQTADGIVDTRYRRAAIGERLAIRVHDYWFVLLRYPQSTYFSRLVVVPIVPDRQRFEAKEP